MTPYPPAFVVTSACLLTAALTVFALWLLMTRDENDTRF